MRWDHNLTVWINSLSGHSLIVDDIFRTVAIAGPFILVFLITIQWWWPREREKHRHLAILCGLSTALGLALNQIILLFYKRVRPYNAGLTHLLIGKSSDPSFPSDHATVGFAIAVSILLLKSRQRYPFLVAAFLLAFSRVYVGVHYFTDVIGGAATATTAASIIYWIRPKLKPVIDRLVRIF